jgi:2-polyprenyl-3-methyl-5-hydroxy-6-metoxy-1,4-benzoquinol methylase
VERRGSSQGSARTAVVWDVLSAALSGTGLSVVDVGGGTGGFAVPLAREGHHVTVVDASPDALAALTRRADEAGVGGSVRAVQGDADGLADLFEPGTADLVLCHSVLEVVDSPAEVAAALAATLRPGGLASVVVASRVAAVLSRAMGGQLEVATAMLRDPDGTAGGRDTLRRRFDVDSASTLLTKAGLTVEQVHGVRVVADFVPDAVAEREHDALLAFELAASGLPVFRDVATQLHLLARK